MNALSAYLPQDRRRALALGHSLPNRTHGAALFADICGFTQLTEKLTHTLGTRLGIEELTYRINKVYDALIGEVERRDGSVIGFAGDAITCWFDQDTGRQAVAAALAMQTAMDHLPDLALKVVVTSGPARRLVVGDSAVQRLDTLAGDTIRRTAVAEHLTRPGELLVDKPTAVALANLLHPTEWRKDAATGEHFALLPNFIGDISSGETASVPATNENFLTPEQCREWLLPAVYEREYMGHGAFLTELRPAAALFLRFTGIDYESDQAEAQLDAFIRQAQAIIVQYEGVLLQLTIGDKGSYLYAAFGAPIAHEDDARRAVKTALELQRMAERLEYLEPVQIGLSRGTMRTGAYGGTTRRTYGVLGDDVNLAARLMMKAAPGEILVTGRVQAVTAAAFLFTPYTAVHLKGKAAPVPVFAVTGSQQRRAIRLQEPDYTLPMVGRKTEMATITAVVDRVLQGQAQVVGIVAEAGMGKSRLIGEIIRLARHKGFVGYGSACQSDGANTPYLVWRGIWSAFFDVDPDLSLLKQKQHLELAVKNRAPARLQALPLLSTVLGISLPDNDFTQTLDPQIRKSALHALLEDCLKAAAREKTLLLVFEDLHWIDALSQDLLEEIIRATTALPVLIVLAYRPSRLIRLTEPRLQALTNFTRIELAELSHADCAQAIYAKTTQLYPARGSNLPPGSVEKLVARAQGNPFYLEELLNYLHDRGIYPDDPAVLDKIDLPDSLHALILSRIDRLGESKRATLRVASIIGRLFRAAWLPGYYPALGDLARVQTDLNELHRLDITALDTPAPELAYLFKHIVTHQVAYESLPFATRSQLHEQLAHYLEIAHPDVPLDTLAHHYGQSANRAKQREYFQKAGDAAKTAFANETALVYFARLLPLLDEPAEQVDLHLRWGEVLDLLGHWEEAESHYQAALELAGEDVARTARSQLAMGRLCQLRGSYQPALAWLAEARQGWARLHNQAGQGQAIIETGRVLWLQGDYETALQQLEQGLALVQTTGDRPGIARALNEMGNVAFLQGDYAAARDLYQQSLALFQAMGDKWGNATGLGSLGLAAHRQGDYTGAQILQEQSLALSREIGDKQGIATALVNLGNLAIEQNNVQAAQMAYGESLKLALEMADKKILFEILGGLAAVAVLLADLPHAARGAATAESLRLSIGAAWASIEGSLYELTVTAVRTGLSEAQFMAAWAEGERMTLDEAVALALQTLRREPL
jgi:adenylate cyclase